MRFQTLHFPAIALLLAVSTGCDAVSQVTGNTWHQKCGWKAEDYFSDPQVVALCQAIEANDLKEIDRLVAAGADVNAKGKDNMTPLMWAFPDNKLPRFTKLLEHGADPNVAIKSDLNTHGGLGKGDSITHMACSTKFPGYFEAVFARGGDVNLIKNGIFKGDTPLFSVIMGGGPNKKEHVRFLIDKGADLNHMNGSRATPTMEAVSWFGQFNIALMLLEAGADYKIYRPKSNQRLIHNVALINDNLKSMWTPEQAEDYRTLVTAEADIKRWQSYNATTPAEYRRKMDAEIAEREAREAGEKAAKGGDQK